MFNNNNNHFLQALPSVVIILSYFGITLAVLADCLLVNRLTHLQFSDADRKF